MEGFPQKSGVLVAGSDARGFVSLGAPRFSGVFKSFSSGLSNGDKTVLKGSNDSLWSPAMAAVALKAGKWYWEITVDAAGTNNQVMIGIGGAVEPLEETAGYGGGPYDYLYYGNNGNKGHSGSFVAYGASYTGGDVIGIALDMDAGKIWYAKNNTWQASGDPATAANPAYTGIVAPALPMVLTYRTGAQMTGRFAAAELTYSPPSGFSPLS